jgi:hypothetical protein
MTGTVMMTADLAAASGLAWLIRNTLFIPKYLLL